MKKVFLLLTAVTFVFSACNQQVKTTEIENPAVSNELMELKDYGPEPIVFDMEDITLQNENFRTSFWTGTFLQMTLMTLQPGEDIGLELHTQTDQFIRVEAGTGTVYMGDTEENLDFIREVKDDFAFFDARVWSVDSLQEVSKVFLWRQEDAIKNAITMAASAYYSHKELMNKGSGVKLEMLKDKGVDFNTYPDFFTRGTFAFTDSFEIELTDDLELSDIAKEQNKRKNITTALRHKIVNDSFIRLKTLDSFDAVSAYLFDPIKKRYDQKMELKKAAKKANFKSP